MKGYAISKRLFGVNGNYAEMIAVFQKKYEAQEKMEQILVDEIAKKNGSDFVETQPVKLKNTGKYYAPYKFIYNISEEHGKSSHLWKKIPFNNYFVVRDSRELDKFVIYEKIDTSGYLMSGYEVRKVYSLEIITCDFVSLGFVDDEPVIMREYYEKSEDEIFFIHEFAEKFKETSKYNELKSNPELKLDVEKENYYV